MATRIVENQKKAFLSQALSSANRLASDLEALSPPQRAAILGIVAKNTNTPLDCVWIAENHTDEQEIALILDGELSRCSGERYSWIVCGNAQWSAVALPKPEMTE